MSISIFLTSKHRWQTAVTLAVLAFVVSLVTLFLRSLYCFRGGFQTKTQCNKLLDVVWCFNNSLLTSRNLYSSIICWRQPNQCYCCCDKLYKTLSYRHTLACLAQNMEEMVMCLLYWYCRRSLFFVCAANMRCEGYVYGVYCDSQFE